MKYEEKIKELYAAEQKKCGLKIGDKVIVTRIANNYENGWNDSWVGHMDEYVGNVYTVEQMDEWGVLLDRYRFPFFVLKKTDGTYKIGMKFKYDDNEYILAAVAYQKVCLINKDTGKRFNDMVHVKHINKITAKEWEMISAGIKLEVI